MYLFYENKAYIQADKTSKILIIRCIFKLLDASKAI